MTKEQNAKYLQSKRGTTLKGILAERMSPPKPQALYLRQCIKP